MTEIQQNRYDQLIRRVNNIVSPGSMVNDSLNELFPTIDVETQVAELTFLSGTKLAFATSSLSAVAANNNLQQLFNPVGSGMIMALVRVDIHAGTGQLYRFDTTINPLTDSTANHRLRDTRAGQTTPPSGQIRTLQQAGGIAFVGSILIPTDVNFTIEDQNGLFVLQPGTGITFSTTVQNTSTEICFWWRERVAQPAELNF